MKKIAWILAIALVLSACGAPAAEEASSAAPSEAASEASSEEASSEEASSEAASSSVEESSSSQAASEAESTVSAPEEASSAASSEAASAAAASEAAAQEAAAQQAAQEAAAQQAAQEAAAQQAAQEAAAQQAAQEAAAQQAAQEAAAQQAAQEAAAQEKPKNKVTISGSNFLSRVEDQLLDLHNEARAQQGLGSLTVNEDLHTAARIRAKELYQQYQRNGKEIAHERPNGDTWSTVLQEDVPMEYSAAGENLCSVVYQKEYIDQKGEDPGRDADWWMEQWLGSPTHREVLMNGRYSQVGFGVYYIKRDGMVYAFATALFIDP